MRWNEDPQELRRRRKEAGMTQKELALRSGVTRAVIADIESERRSFTGPVQDALWEAIAEQDIPRQRKALEQVLNRKSTDPRVAMDYLLNLISSPGPDEEMLAKAAMPLLEERYARLTPADREWFGKQIAATIEDIETMRELGLEDNPLALPLLLGEPKPPQDISAVKKTLERMQKRFLKRVREVPLESPEQAENRRLREALAARDRQIYALRKLLAADEKLIEILKAKSADDEARIQEAMAEAKDLRDYYQAETEAVLATERAQQLRDKVK